jgi:cellulose synthase/poly-beta-1,6-N-acetylglucosamine synthase-like glycosyltransferase
VIVDVTFLSTVMAIAVAYYVALFLLLWVKRVFIRFVADHTYDPVVIVVIPAHNEEDVIAHTIESLLAQDYEHKLIMVMNDGSKDRTSEIARRYTGEGVVVVDRGASIAGRGKGAVLNHAYRLVNGMVDDAHPALLGRSAENIIIAIMDADGQLEQHSITNVVPYFAQSNVGGVQIGVRIANARTSVLTRMQDVEFVGFSAFVQEVRDWFGSVGLGGNGQFTRLAALRSTGRRPWTDCLTEDLDLGLTLVKNGWRVRFCPDAWVAQQGVDNLRILFRQRTRWIQGHYQCWSHIPSLATEERVPLGTRIDLLIYLVMVVFIVFIMASMVLGWLAQLGLITVFSSFLGFVTPAARPTVKFVLSFGPLLLFMATYQMKSRHRLRPHEFPAYAAAFSLYTYAWIIAQLWAWWRLARGTSGWVKTPRVRSESAV